MTKTPSNPTVICAIGDNLIAARTAKGWSQSHCAALAGCSEAHLRSIERSTADPRLSTLMRLADALEITLEELIMPTSD